MDFGSKIIEIQGEKIKLQIVSSHYLMFHIFMISALISKITPFFALCISYTIHHTHTPSYINHTSYTIHNHVSYSSLTPCSPRLCSGTRQARSHSGASPGHTTGTRLARCWSST
ncbi:hypothetical protein EON65_46660 [archaeon]|nr:MAG: hypothetical protein EON65_46660 [archaeon]